MTLEELIRLVHIMLMCGIKDKTALDNGIITNEEWADMMRLIDKFQQSEHYN